MMSNSKTGTQICTIITSGLALVLRATETAVREARNARYKICTHLNCRKFLWRCQEYLAISVEGAFLRRWLSQDMSVAAARLKEVEVVGPVGVAAAVAG